MTESSAADADDRERPPNEWEVIGREALWLVLEELHNDIAADLDNVANAVYWNGQPYPEELERLRQSLDDIRYVTEVYLAVLCPETEPRGDPDPQTPSWLPVVTEHSDTDETIKPPKTQAPDDA